MAANLPSPARGPHAAASAHISVKRGMIAMQAYFVLLDMLWQQLPVVDSVSLVAAAAAGGGGSQGFSH